ncbi:hypothetical protein Aperf_G00000024682 [Anoplocephala perfoliata]
MALSPRSSSFSLRKAFSNLLTSRHLNNFTSLCAEISLEYLIQNIPDGDDHNLPPKKQYSAPDELLESKLGGMHSVSGIPHQSQLERRHFKHPLIAIVPLIADHQPFHQLDELLLFDPPPSGHANAYGSHLTTTYFAGVDSPKVNLSINYSLPPLDLDPSFCQLIPLYIFRTSASSKPKSVISEAKSHRSQAASSSPARRGEFDIVNPRSKSSGKYCKILEGMDGVTVGAATCLLATRKHPKPPNGMFNVDKSVLLKAKNITDEAIKKNKVFAVLGPYRHIREGMRRRGWVEKFYGAPIGISGERFPVFQNGFTHNSANTSSNSDCANGDIDYGTVQQEDLPHSGRNVRNIVPNFIWSLKKAHIDFRYLRPNQIVNHHVKAPFTTKIGLCRQLRHYNLYSDKNENSLFPRCYIISSEEERLRFINDEITRRCRRTCDSLKVYYPQFELDGQRNIWIVKPGSKSRGRGITCHANLDTILSTATNPNNTDNKFVVQKYIERPLLIYNTKFDIRQWFLIADWQPLTIWWYKECYLRFCSREFTLDNFSENIGHRHIWDRRILPGMQKAIINSMLCSQDTIDARKCCSKGCFELYGADFMISADDMRPWLIEINASPCMAPSTSVTSDLTAKVLEDTLKVIIDRRRSRNCDVGGFVLLYRQRSGLPGTLQRENSQNRISGDWFFRSAMTLPDVIRPLSVEPKSSSLPSRCSDPLLTRDVAGDEETRFRADDQARSTTPDLHGLSISSRNTYSRRNIKSAPRSRNPSVRRAVLPQTRRSNNQVPRFPAILPNDRSPRFSSREKEMAFHGLGSAQVQKFRKSGTY